jgi:hypothetical protein
MWSDENEPMRDADVARLEAMLHEGLQRRDAPEGLQEKILARAMAARSEERRRQNMLRRRIGGRRLQFPLEGRRWAVQRIAASVVLGVMVAGAAAYYQAEQRQTERRAEETRAQVMEALRITTRTLDKVQAQLSNGE